MLSLLNSFLPSCRIGKQGLPFGSADPRYAPLPIHTMKVTPLIRHRILSRRHPLPLTFENDKRLTVIIPYRNRAAHLQQLLPPLRAALARQSIDAEILVVEQAGDGFFNRGKLINAGVAHVPDSDYYCFHDVDMIPEIADYRCPSQPLRLITQLVCSHRGRSSLSGPFLGGVVSMRRDQFQAINGFSNQYWGWGQEDDDFLMRCLMSGLVPYEDLNGLYQDLATPEPEIQVNKVVKKRGSNRRLKSAMWRGLTDFSAEGFGSLSYKLLDVRRHDFYDHIVVDIGHVKV